MHGPKVARQRSAGCSLPQDLRADAMKAGGIHVHAVGHPFSGPRQERAELRAALEERNAAGNAAAPHALWVNMFAPEPTLVHAIRFENLAAIEAYQDKQLADPAFLAQTGKIGQCLSRPQSVLLFEQLWRTGAATQPKFLLRTRLSPAAGKVAGAAGRLRGAAEEGSPSWRDGSGLWPASRVSRWARLRDDFALPQHGRHR